MAWLWSPPDPVAHDRVADPARHGEAEARRPVTVAGGGARLQHETGPRNALAGSHRLELGALFQTFHLPAPSADGV